MFNSHLISRMRQLLFVFLLIFMFVTTIISTSGAVPSSTTADVTPTPSETTDGWSDPVGG